MIALGDGSIAATPQQATERWRRHFASMEGGSVVTRQALLQQVSEPSEQVSMDLQQIPSLFELEKQLRASRTQRAMGPDNIPGELLHFAPQYLAHALWPLYIKQSLTISEAIQYKGGRLVSAYKRRGDYKDCNSHRALLVSSSLGKAMHNTFRRRAQAFVRSSAGDMQVTSRQDPSVLLAAHTVRCHMNIAKAHLDQCICAISGHQSGVLPRDSPIRLWCWLLRRTYSAISAQNEYRGILHWWHCPYAWTGTSTPTSRLPRVFAQASNTTTWLYLVRPCWRHGGSQDGAWDPSGGRICGHNMEPCVCKMDPSNGRTSPPPQVLSPPLMWNNEVGLNTAIGEHAVPYSLVAWADDVVILGLDEDPEQLLSKLKFSCQTMVEELTSYGLIPDPRGNGSTQIRRRIFTAGRGILELDTQLPDQPHLRLVPKYKHLGGPYHSWSKDETGSGGTLGTSAPGLYYVSHQAL